VEYGRNAMFMHLTLVPYLRAANEIKTKPTQHSVKELRSIGIQADVLLCRSEIALTDAERSKIALFTNVPTKAVISALDAKNGIYDIPVMLHEQGLDDIVVERLGLTAGPAQLDDWREVVDRSMNTRLDVTVAVVGKYVEHADAYKSLTEALAHGGLRQRIRVNLKRIESDGLDDGDLSQLDDVDAILVPGGFGERGFEGKVNAIKHAREQGIPYLGICYGMQAAVVEFARNVCGLKGANTTEIEQQTPHPVIGLITEWLDRSGKVEKRHEDSDLGGTMRLGGQRCRLREGSLSRQLYGQEIITERHRHRYEFNNHYRDEMQKHGMVLSGMSMDETLVEMIELPTHPWFVACQFHPEFTSTPRAGHPLFTGFIEAALRSQQGELPAQVARL
jgi:CTP synthase